MICQNCKQDVNCLVNIPCPFCDRSFHSSFLCEKCQARFVSNHVLAEHHSPINLI